MKATINIGAQVGQDHQFVTWTSKFFPKHDLNTLFDCEPMGEGSSRWKCISFGYGLLGSNDPRAYGNGPLYVNHGNLSPVFVHETPPPFSPVDCFWMVWSSGPKGHIPTIKHDSYESAYKEASRLAALHSGTLFFVLVSCAGVISRAVVEQVPISGGPDAA